MFQPHLHRCCALAAVFATLACLLSASMAQAEEASGYGHPLHQVRGQGIVQLSPPNGEIYTVFINAWEDDTGVHGVATWCNQMPFWDGYPRGWQWVIELDTLTMLSDNEVRVEGVIVHDNKFPEWTEGDRVSIGPVTDNGQGASDPADQIFGVPIQGGNFIVQ
jgi:hypothetical protein